MGKSDFPPLFFSRFHTSIVREKGRRTQIMPLDLPIDVSEAQAQDLLSLGKFALPSLAHGTHKEEFWYIPRTKISLALPSGPLPLLFSSNAGRGPFIAFIFCQSLSLIMK